MESASISVKTNPQYMYAVYPYWYQLNIDGTLNKTDHSENADFLEYLNNEEILTLPMIANDCDTEIVHAFLSNTEAIDKNIEEVVNLVNKMDYDGANIAYECMEASDKARYSDFITRLSNELHNNNKLLYLAVHAKTDDTGTWGGPQSQDWSVVNQYADKVIIMTYDYHWETSEAGDIAPISWMRNVLDYAITEIDNDKIYLGIHFYGYDWLGQKAESLTYSDVENIIQANSPTINNSYENEKYFSYTGDGGLRTVYFADHETIRQRVDLINEYNIAGISIWRLGNEDTENWDIISNSFNSL